MKRSIQEKNRKVASSLFVVQLIAVILLIGISPIVMMFTPWIEPYELNELTAKFCIRPRDEIRYLMIMLGLGFGWVSIVCPFIEIMFCKQSYSRLVLETTIGFCGFSLGWKCFPFWVTGTFQAYLGKAPLAFYDPLHIPPGLWLGPIWYLPVLLLYPFTFIISFIFIYMFYTLLRQRSFLIALFSSLFFVIALLTSLLEPDLGIWLLD